MVEAPPGLPAERERIGLDTNPVTIDLADRSAELRARYRLRTPDAIQLATAIGHKATRFYGNDRGLRRVKEIDCVIVEEVA